MSSASAISSAIRYDPMRAAVPPPPVFDTRQQTVGAMYMTPTGHTPVLLSLVGSKFLIPHVGWDTNLFFIHLKPPARSR